MTCTFTGNTNEVPRCSRCKCSACVLPDGGARHWSDECVKEGCMDKSGKHISGNVALCEEGWD